MRTLNLPCPPEDTRVRAQTHIEQINLNYNNKQLATGENFTHDCSKLLTQFVQGYCLVVLATYKSERL